MKNRKTAAALCLFTALAAVIFCLSGCGKSASKSSVPAAAETTADSGQDEETSENETESGISGQPGAASGSSETVVSENSGSGTGDDAAAEPKEDSTESVAAESDAGQENISSDSTGDANFDVLLNAAPGEKVVTGMNAYGADNWYKFYEDEDFIYLLYGDYYNLMWRTDIEKSGLIRSSTYELMTYNHSGTDSENLLNYLLDEEIWSGMNSSFAHVYPQRTIKVTGGPTKEQMETVMNEYPAAVDMLRPYTEKFDNCLGYWLATEASPGELYEYNCVLVNGGIESNYTSNGDAIRPLVAISKQLRDKTTEELNQELMSAAESEAAARGNGVDKLTIGDHTLQYGKYRCSYDFGLTVCFEIKQDGDFAYTSSSSDYVSTGFYRIAALDSGSEEWNGAMQLEFIFDKGGFDQMTVPEDNVLEAPSGDRYLYSEE